MKKFNEDAWYVDLIGCLVALSLAYSMGTMEGYEEYINSSELPSGKSAKLGLYIMKLADGYGGKSLVVKICLGGALLALISSIRKYIKAKRELK